MTEEQVRHASTGRGTRAHSNKRLPTRLWGSIGNVFRLANRWSTSLFIGLWILTFLFGYFGFQELHYLKGQEANWTDTMYLTLQLFVLASGYIDWSGGSYVLILDIARWLAIVVSFWAVAAIMMNLFRERLRNVRLRLCHDHLVICGTGHIGSRLIRSLQNDPIWGRRRMVIIEKKGNAVDDRTALNTLVLQGDATDKTILEKAGVDRASVLVPALGSDSKNVEVAFLAGQIITERGGRSIVGKDGREPLKCCVLVQDAGLREMLFLNEMNHRHDGLSLEFPDLLALGARIALDEHSPYLETKCEGNRNEHLVLVGLDDWNERLLAEAAKRWLRSHGSHGPKLGLTVVDAEATSKMNALRLQYPSLDQFCEITTVDRKVNRGTFDDELIGALRSERAISCAYVSLDDESECLSVAVSLSRRMRNVPIVVRFSAGDDLSALINAGLGTDRDGTVRSGIRNVHVFDFWDRVCTSDLTEGGNNLILAREIHKDYYRRHHADREWRPAQTLWDGLSDEDKAANLAQAAGYADLMVAAACDIGLSMDWEEGPFRFTPFEVCMLSMLEHDRWSRFKKDHGWKYGPNFDREMKIHPNIVDWGKLDDQTKKKDMEAVVNISSVLRRVDLKIFRRNKAEMIGEALFLNGEKSIREDINRASAWHNLHDGEREAFIQKGKNMELLLWNAGLGISGARKGRRGEFHLNPQEAMALGRVPAEAGLPSSSKWAELLDSVNLELFRLEDARELVATEAENLRHLFNDGDPIMNYTDAELADPFTPSRSDVREGT